jgi:hypothetical protein
MLRVGYEPTLLGPAWDDSAALNAIIGHPYALPGWGVRVFFFAGHRWTGEDAANDSLSLTASRDSGTQVTVRYSLYNSADPACCPQGGTVAVRFRWTGHALVTLDPVPAPVYRNNGA